MSLALPIVCTLLNLWLLLAEYDSIAQHSRGTVSIFHQVEDDWFPWAKSGDVDCNVKCNYLRKSSLQNEDAVQAFRKAQRKNDTTVVIFIRDLWGQDYYPSCLLNATLTFMGSWEPAFRTNLVKYSPYDFDGNISTHADSTIPYGLIYADMFSDQYGEFEPTRSFSELFKGASFVASNCDQVEYVPTRDDVVEMLRHNSVLVDGLGKCEKSTHPDVNITRMHNDKMKEISYYLFNICFENAVEPGYVTEKIFDALLSGTVPVYYGDDDLVRQLLPDPKAAIFWSDFDRNASKLASYLKYLSRNETAYELHRQWRHTPDGFNFKEWYVKHKQILNWRCRICNYASTHPQTRRKSVCQRKQIESMLDEALGDQEGDRVPITEPCLRFRDQNYFVYKDIMYQIPDSTTFISLGYTYNDCKDINSLVNLTLGSPLPSVRINNLAFMTTHITSSVVPTFSPSMPLKQYPSLGPIQSPTAPLISKKIDCVSGESKSFYNTQNVSFLYMIFCFLLGCVFREIVNYFCKGSCCFKYNKQNSGYAIVNSSEPVGEEDDLSISTDSERRIDDEMEGEGRDHVELLGNSGKN